MPAHISKNSSGGFTVSTPNGVHAKNTTKEKADAQVRLLNAVDHGFVPHADNGHVHHDRSAPKQHTHTSSPHTISRMLNHST